MDSPLSSDLKASYFVGRSQTWMLESDEESENGSKDTEERAEDEALFESASIQAGCIHAAHFAHANDAYVQGIELSR